MPSILDWLRPVKRKAFSFARMTRSFLFRNTTDTQTVAKNTVWLSISNFGGRLLKAVIIIYAARVLDPAGLGVFSYAVTLAGFLTFFVDPGLNVMLIREGSKSNEEYKARLLSTTFYIKILLIALAAAFVLVAGPFFSTLPGAKLLLPIVALILLGDTMREFFSSLLRAKEKMERDTAVFLSTNLCIVIFGLVALKLFPTPLAFGWAYAVGTTLGALFALWAARSSVKKLFSKFSFELFAPIVRSAWPFAITGTLGILLTNTDILILSWLKSASDVGVYSAVVRIIQLLYLVPVIIQYATLPLLSRLAHANNARFREMLERTVAAIFAVSIPLAFGGIILSASIMTTVFGTAYASGASSMMLLMLSTLVDYPGGVISLAVFAYDRQKILVIASLIGAVTNVTFDLLFIPRFGIVGSAMATLVAQILNNGYLWYAMKKINYFSVIPRLKKIFFAAAFMASFTALLLALGTNMALNIVLSGIVYAVLLVLFKEPLVGEMTKLLKIPEPEVDPKPVPAIPNAKASVRIRKVDIAVEVAKDTAAVRAGLSGRESLAQGSGMLFVFAKPKRYRFWMRNMRFPLDIIWIRGGEVVGVTENIAPQPGPAGTRFYVSPEKADSVLEVNAGFVQEQSIRTGDTITFRGVRPEFEIVSAPDEAWDVWNEFVARNGPPIGAFLETWEWGSFQKQLGLQVERYMITENHELAAVFIFVKYPLPLGLSYGYLPRGPLVAKERVAAEMSHFEILQRIQAWAHAELSPLLFLRMEPPLASISRDSDQYGFCRPSYHIQPPRNTAVPVDKTEEEILARFHPSTRSNIKRAQRRGVTFEMKKTMTQKEYDDFFAMIRSTSSRTHGRNAYPSQEYLRTFLSSNRIVSASDEHLPAGMSLGIFFGYQNDEPAAVHIVVFSGTTATYLFGASNTRHLPSKVDTYLHWVAMLEAKRRGMHYYDIGGIDERIWPSLTTFKRQFGGDEFEYVGNIDVPLRPLAYRAYNFSRKLLKKMRKQA